MDTEFELKRQKSKEKELTRLSQCLGLQYTGFFILTCHKLITGFELSTVKLYTVFIRISAQPRISAHLE